MRAVAITCVKNEAAFLIEWLAHHRAVGFTDFLVFSNDCDDGTDAMLDHIAQFGWLTHVRNPSPHARGPQWAALKTASKHDLFQAADWAMVLDVDEFVNVHIGTKRLDDLLTALSDADAIAMTWRLFGNGGQVSMRDAPITETFTRAAPATLGWPWRAQMFKTLFRGPAHGPYAKLGVHRPQGLADNHAPRWYDGSGRLLNGSFAKNRLFTDFRRDNYAMVQLNHYPLGAIENYLVKAERGRANRDASPFDMGYWVERNLNEVEDRSILALESASFRAQMHADTRLHHLHQRGFAWRQEQFAKLMTQEPWRALYGRLRMCGPSMALPADISREITRHIAKNP